MVASVPEFTSRIISTAGTRRAISSAISISASVGAPKLVPRSAACFTAATTAGWACPRMSGPHEQTRSTYRLPSTSTRYGPAPDWMNRGVPPTARKARTGEFTPPGMRARARSKHAAEATSVPGEVMGPFFRRRFRFLRGAVLQAEGGGQRRRLRRSAQRRESEEILGAAQQAVVVEPGADPCSGRNRRGDHDGRNPIRGTDTFIEGEDDDQLTAPVCRRIQQHRQGFGQPAVTGRHRTVVHVMAEIRCDEGEGRQSAGRGVGRELRVERHVVVETLGSLVDVVRGWVVFDGVLAR